jgi:HEAT repeat protein
MRAVDEHAQRLAALEGLPDGPERERVVLAALEDPSAVVRERAIRLAARYIEPHVLSELVGDEANAIRRNAAISALERQGPYAVPHLRTLLGHPDADVVMFALQMLSRIGDPLAVHGVVPLLRHSNPNVAQSAVEALGQLRHREAVPTLIELLEGDLWLQLAAIDALGAIGDPVAVAPLLSLIPDSIVAEPAILALQSIAAPESLDPLLDKLLLVKERPLRDALLLALGVVIDLHPDPVPIAASRRAAIELDPRQEMSGYLGEIMGWSSGAAGVEAPGDGRDHTGLLRAATAVTVIGGLRSLYPPILMRLATDQDAGWIVGLFRRHPGALSPALRELLRHRDHRVRQGALLVGAFAAEDLACVIEHLEDPDPMVRAAACRALGVINNPDTVSLLIERLCEGEPSERMAAVAALTEFTPAALGGLSACLGLQVSEPVLVAALEVLGRRGVPRFESRIAELARHESPVIRRAAVRAAAPLPGAKSEVVLIRALADSDAAIQMEALDLLVRRDPARTITTLTALLQANDSLRGHVIRALGKMRAMEAYSHLESLYENCSRHERAEIVVAMTRIGGAKIAEFLSARLRESDTEIRRLAARGLAMVADRTRLTLLVALAADADWSVRAEAARGLGRLRLVECHSTLLTLCRDIEPGVAGVAREAIAVFRKTDPAAA